MGERKTAIPKAPAIAKINVHAMGLNILPSIPSKVSIGTNTSIMIPTPKIIGRITPLPDSMMHCWRSVLVKVLFNKPCFSLNFRKLASVITTDPSTIIPKSIAPRLKRLAAIDSSCIPIMAKSMENGITIATSRPAR